MLISLNDHPDIRARFSHLYQETAEIRYTVGGGAGTEARELLLWNQACEDRRPAFGNLEMF